MTRKILIPLIMFFVLPYSLNAQVKNAKLIVNEDSKIVSGAEKPNGLSLKLELFTDDAGKSQKVSFCISDSIYVGVTAYFQGSRSVNFASKDPMIRFHPIILANGESYAFSPEAKQKIKDAVKINKESIWYSGPTIRIPPNEGYKLATLNVSDWYGRLPVGVYQLSIEFDLDGQITKSDTVAFEIATCDVRFD
jgi:hypothetical protein